MARIRLPDGSWAEGTPEELARLVQLLKSQQGERPVRSPVWVDKTGSAEEAD